MITIVYMEPSLVIKAAKTPGLNGKVCVVVGKGLIAVEFLSRFRVKCSNSLAIELCIWESGQVIVLSWAASAEEIRDKGVAARKEIIWLLITRNQMGKLTLLVVMASLARVVVLFQHIVGLWHQGDHGTSNFQREQTQRPRLTLSGFELQSHGTVGLLPFFSNTVRSLGSKKDRFISILTSVGVSETECAKHMEDSPGWFSYRSNSSGTSGFAAGVVAVSVAS